MKFQITRFTKRFKEKKKIGVTFTLQNISIYQEVKSLTEDRSPTGTNESPSTSPSDEFESVNVG